MVNNGRNWVAGSLVLISTGGTVIRICAHLNHHRPRRLVSYRVNCNVIGLRLPLECNWREPGSELDAHPYQFGRRTSRLRDTGAVVRTKSSTFACCELSGVPRSKKAGIGLAARFAARRAGGRG